MGSIAFASIPFFAAGALCASAPLIIHLLNRRRYRVVQWAAMEFLRPLQRIDRGLRRQTIVLIITALGNVDHGHRPLQLIESVPKTNIPRSGFAFYITAIIAAGQPQGRWAAVVTSGGLASVKRPREQSGRDQ